MTLSRLALLGAALLLAFAVWVFWPQQPLQGARGGTPPIAALSPAVEAFPQSKAWTAGRAAPLPPADTPIRMLREELVSRALAGDAPAACRWATELQRCAALPYDHRSLRRARENQQNEYASPYVRRRADEEVARLQQNLHLTEGVCEGVTPTEPTVAWKFLLSAAQAGHVPSMLLFADGAAMREHMIPSRSESAEAWMLHRQLAPGFLARAVESGSPAAVFMSALAYEKGNWFGEPLLPQDSTLALAHWMALASVSTGEYADYIQPNIRKLRQSPIMTEQALAHAQKLADQITGKLQTAGARDINYRNGPFSGGKHRHCD